MRSHQSERFTAIHEAGHAVAHRRLCDWRYTGDVSIEPKPEEGTLGSAAVEELWTEDPDDYRIEVVAFCAGYAAAVLYGEDPGVARLGAGDDFEKAEEKIVEWQLEPLETHIGAATELLSRPENRRAIELLTTRLLSQRTLRSDDVDLLIDLSDGEISEAEYEMTRRFRDHT